VSLMSYAEIRFGDAPGVRALVDCLVAAGWRFPGTGGGVCYHVWAVDRDGEPEAVAFTAEADEWPAVAADLSRNLAAGRKVAVYLERPDLDLAADFAFRPDGVVEVTHNVRPMIDECSRATGFTALSRIILCPLTRAGFHFNEVRYTDTYL